MRSIGTLSDVAGNRATDPDAPQTERQRIEGFRETRHDAGVAPQRCDASPRYSEKDGNENVCIHTPTQNENHTQAKLETQVESKTKNHAEAKNQTQVSEAKAKNQATLGRSQTPCRHLSTRRSDTFRPPR